MNFIENSERPRGSNFYCIWEGQRPSDEDIAQIIKDHSSWLCEKEGRDKDDNFSPHNLTRANLSHVNLMHANLSEAIFIGADLSRAKLDGANLRKARLAFADLTEANLTTADLKGANLAAANLSNANVLGVKFNRKTKFLGSRLATCYGSPEFLSFALHQEYLEGMRLTRWGRVKRFFWWLFADCGRTIWRWVVWSLIFAFGFACIFFYLNQGGKAFSIDVKGLPNDFHTMLYYSVVTFTTLGFGDITPLTRTASYWVMAEVIMGYIMLGGLISIFATKLARRF